MRCGPLALRTCVGLLGRRYLTCAASFSSSRPRFLAATVLILSRHRLRTCALDALAPRQTSPDHGGVQLRTSCFGTDYDKRLSNTCAQDELANAAGCFLFHRRDRKSTRLN